ncbi:ferredoxin family protein [candidate division KSB1 bacterium]|nr:ferredoxin family protein [candidate division KSB1 bacterium]
MTYIIIEPCIGTCDTSCVDVCPVDCIYPQEGYTLSDDDKKRMLKDGEMLYIHPEECIDCGACEPECPVEAIFPEEDVPEDQEKYIAINYTRFGFDAPS